MAKRRKKLNINRVRHFLFEKYKRRFGFRNWDDTLFKGRQITEELKNYQLTDSQKNITRIVNQIKPPKPRKKKADKLPDPELPQEAFGVTSFWEIQKLISLIKSSDNRIYFYSKYIFNQGNKFFVQGGTLVDYETHLNNWAKTSSKLQNSYKTSGGDDYAPYWRILEQPKKEKGKYFAEIITCDDEGGEIQFTTETYQGKEFEKLEKLEVTTPTTKQPELSEKQLTPIEKEQLKEQKLKNLIAYKDSLMKDIEFKEKRKRNTDDLEKKYDNVTKQIDDLML